jgi:hypothetical protein
LSFQPVFLMFEEGYIYDIILFIITAVRISSGERKILPGIDY